MPAGLQVWDANGRLVADFTDRLMRFHSRGETTAPYNSSRFIVVPEMSADGSWYVASFGMTPFASGSGRLWAPDVVTAIGNGGFTIWNYVQFNTVLHYAVYRA